MFLPILTSTWKTCFFFSFLSLYHLRSTLKSHLRTLHFSDIKWLEHQNRQLFANKLKMLQTYQFVRAAPAPPHSPKQQARSIYRSLRMYALQFSTTNCEGRLPARVLELILVKILSRFKGHLLTFCRRGTLGSKFEAIWEVKFQIINLVFRSKVTLVSDVCFS